MKDVLESIVQRVKKEPFARLLGMELKDIGPGYSIVEMAFRPEMENIHSMAHGGAIFALIDEAFETASNSHGTVAVALNMNVTYITSPPVGSLLRAEAREVSLTRRTASYLINVIDAKGHLVATCQALVYRKDEKLPFIQREMEESAT
ncbi:MAG: thioesterase [Deltaproteobacteria bacterium RBG_13_52_11]|nr:MAG: thioesterase [Deltaproteobacteria bacterium RBG_13_52_11]